jgi:uncharacterized protein YabN with tetrapyrrole methylase and pyrophosphatase domain
MTDYKKEYLKQKEENEYLKEDIKNLRNIIENLRKENCEISCELQLKKSESMEFKSFSNDGTEAVGELLELIKNSDNYTYTEHKHNGIFEAYYDIYSKKGYKIFILENHNNGRSEKGLLTTPPTSNIMEENRKLYEDNTSNWDAFGGSNQRKKFNIKGEKYITILNLFDKFN